MVKIFLYNQAVEIMDTTRIVWQQYSPIKQKKRGERDETIQGTAS
jgi:hypothetical protein